MNLAMDQLADNPIIDELVEWPPRSEPIQRIRACSVLFRKPFIEVSLANGEVFQRHFQRPSFAESWAEARVILQTLTSIELVTEFRCPPVADQAALIQRVLDSRDEAIAEANLMFEQGMYAQYLMQFGADCAGLPEEVQARLQQARQHLQPDF